MLTPWKLIDTARVPGSRRQLHLYQRETEFSIQVDALELMNSRVTVSEHGFSELGCARIRDRLQPRVLIGGLGMGYSLKTALDALVPEARVIVAELVPAVVKWNRSWLAHLAGHPLRDPRVMLREVDVSRVLREAASAYDLILLDVDNGPEGLTHESNDWLYTRAGLDAARSALRPHGVLGFWSSGPNPEFVGRLKAAGFDVDEIELPAAIGCYGVMHTIWLAVVSPDA
ncbi:MAG TPA: hypothetical protein VGI70_17680 [Polyangiales bacterium]